MATSERELARRILDAGTKLLSPPSSIDQLLISLERVETLLVGVDQSPSKSMKEALVPSTKALINVELLRHSDADVKVALASCISEITRITAPEAPYEDDQMKEVFQLIVSSFEKLHDKSDRSYDKRIAILDTVAKVRSCVVMLDLECDELIVEMFRHFFRTIRDDHPNSVFSSMEKIMTLVVEESDDISVDLLSPMLDVLKKENKDVLPIACQLGEKVFVKCAGKLRPYLLPAVSFSGTSLNDYIKVVADVFQAGDDAAQTNMVAPPSDVVGPEVDTKKSPDAPILSPEVSYNERADISSPSSSGSLADETRSEKDEQRKKKEDPIITSTEVVSGKESDTKEDLEKATGSKSKLNKHAIKNSSSHPDLEVSVPDSDVDTKEEADEIHELDDSAAMDSAQDIEFVKPLADKKTRGQAKATPAKGNKKTPAVDKAVGLPKSTPKSNKDISDMDEASRSSSKRKQRLSEEKAPKTKVYDLELVGATVKVWWPDDKKYYQGVVDSFDAIKKKHKILYSDGEIEILNLKEEKWLLVDGSKGHMDDGESPDELELDDATPKGKKAKINASSGSKQGKTWSVAKKSGTSFSKSKAAPKSESKQMSKSKTAAISKEEATKKVSKPNADKSRKSIASKSSNRLSDDEEEDTPIGSIKSKDGTTKGASKPKGKSPKSNVRSNSSGIGKVKASNSTKDEESEDDSLEPERTPEKSNEKSHPSLRVQRRENEV